MSEPTYVPEPEPEAPLTTDQKLDKLLSVVAGHDEMFDSINHTLTGIRDELTELHTKVAAIEETVVSHTAILDGIVKQLSILSTDHTAVIHRLDRHEAVIKRLATQAGVTLDWDGV